MKNVIQRAVVGLVMLVFVGATIFFGQKTLFVMTLFLSITGFLEINCVLKLWDMRAPQTITVLFGVLTLLAFAFRRPDLAIGSVGMLLITLGVFTVTHQATHAKNAIGALFTMVYIFLPFGLLMDMPDVLYIYLVVIAAWGTDTFAYVFGMLFGKHKLIPSVSPKKSVEGAVGGTISSIVLAVLLLRYLSPGSMLQWVVIMLFASILGQFGDLFASKIKRESGLKDYGTIFLGHGGVLDRFDSMLFVIPYLYTISRILP